MKSPRLGVSRGVRAQEAKALRARGRPSFPKGKFLPSFPPALPHPENGRHKREEGDHDRDAQHESHLVEGGEGGKGKGRTIKERSVEVASERVGRLSQGPSRQFVPSSCPPNFPLSL